MIRRPPRSPLFPYPPLFRSSGKNPIFEFEMGSLQEMDQVTIARSITKWAKTCFDTRHLADYTTAALRHALSGRRSEERTSELQSLAYLVCRLLLEKKK